MEPSERRGIEILGQRLEYPDSPWGAIAVGVLCVLGGFVAWLVVERADPARLKELGYVWRSISVQPDDDLEVQAGAYRLEFWTPSARTKDAYNGRDVPEKDKWEILQDETKVLEFGDKLKADARVEGFRRFEEFGHGRTDRKWGWWWIVGVKDDFSVRDLIRLYRGHWGAEDRIYIETIRRRSEYASEGSSPAPER